MYYRHFGLAGAPFKFTPSPGTLYFSAAHYEGLAALQWGFRERGGLMLLVGEIGTGKSTLIDWMLQQPRDESIRIALVTNPTYTFAEMLQVIRSQLRIHPVGAGARAMLQALKTFVGDPGAGDRVILIFDEAQGLSDEILEQLLALSKLTGNGGQSLQIVLVGQLDLEARLNAPRYQALRERIGFRSRLNPLKPGEIPGYVEHLLGLQGGRPGIFSPEALDEVVRLSGGIPRTINMICHNALLLAYAEGAPGVDGGHVRAAQAEFRILQEYEAVSPSAAFEAGGARRPRKIRPSAVALGLAGVAAAAVAFAVGLQSGGRIDTMMTHSGTTVSGRLAKPSGPAVDDSNGNRWQTAEAQANSVQSTRRMPPAPAPRAAALGAPGATRSVDGANAVGHPATVAKALPAGGPKIASPGETAAEAALESRHAAAPELAAGRKIHRRRWRWRRTRLARRPTPAAVRAEDDIAAGDRDGAEPDDTVAEVHNAAGPDDTADVDEGVVAPAAPLSPKVKSLVHAETSEGDAHMARGDYGVALRKFKTAQVLDPSDGALREKIERAEQAGGSTR
jgi:general secretion pathway protein A